MKIADVLPYGHGSSPHIWNTASTSLSANAHGLPAGPKPINKQVRRYNMSGYKISQSKVEG